MFRNATMQPVLSGGGNEGNSAVRNSGKLQKNNDIIESFQVNKSFQRLLVSSLRPPLEININTPQIPTWLLTEFLSLLHRIEKEIEDLETQELDISANEEVVLKRLKEVERTPEDIIKVGLHKLSASCTPRPSAKAACCFWLPCALISRGVRL